VQILEHAGRNARALERLEKALGAQRRLVRRFEHHGIAGNQRRQHGVDRRQIRIIPRRNHYDEPERHSLDLTLEAGLVGRPQRGQRLGRDLEHITCALFKAANLAGCMRDGASHLPGDFRGNLARLGDEGVDGPP
jgi:hypothetical protein